MTPPCTSRPDCACEFCSGLRKKHRRSAKEIAEDEREDYLRHLRSEYGGAEK
jgi:hypothetical protein